jgi:hypothetical protein
MAKIAISSEPEYPSNMINSLDKICVKNVFGKNVLKKLLVKKTSGKKILAPKGASGLTLTDNL